MNNNVFITFDTYYNLRIINFIKINSKAERGV